MMPFTRREFLATAAALAAQRAGAVVVPADAGNVALHRVGPGSPDATRPNFRNARTRRPLPSPSQITWQQDERALFVHFGINTFTDREWGDGRESPLLFAPSALDARQWARAARAAGFRAMVLTAKHHDGFCLWPTRTTAHSVKSSAWRNGEGDVVRLFVDACRAEGLRPGLYCSPWDRHEPSYGDSPRYNDLYCDQLTELLTWYGDIHEVWFDGANGEGPNGRRQEYDWPRFWALVRRLQPNAVMFSDAGPDIRWIGNEQGTAGDPNWSTVDPDTVPVPGLGGDAVIRQLQHGDANGTVWRPGECDVSIRPGWFHHAAEDGRVRDVDDLVRLYFASVGRNAKLLLNVPATTAGLLHEVDVARLDAMHSSLTRLFEERVASMEFAINRPDAQHSVEISLERAPAIAIAELREDIRNGQAVARYRLEGYDDAGWSVLARGSTIGHCKLNRLAAVSPQRIRLTVEDAIDWPVQVRLRLYAAT